MKCAQEGVEPSTVKLIVTVVDALATLRSQIEKANRDMLRQAAGYEKLATRFTRKQGADNKISPVFLRRAAQQRTHVELNLGKIAIVEKAAELAASYDFQTDRPMPNYGFDMGGASDMLTITVNGQTFRVDGFK